MSMVFKNPLVYISIFIVLMIVNYFCSKWLLLELFSSAGVTKEDVFEYRKRLRGSTNTYRKLTNWLILKSHNKEKTRRLYRVYILCTLPSVISVNISFMSCFTNFFNSILDYTLIFVAILNIILAVLGIARKMHK